MPSHPANQPPNSTMSPKSPSLSFSPIQTVEVSPHIAANLLTNKGPAPQLAMLPLEYSTESPASDIDFVHPRTDNSHFSLAHTKISNAMQITNPLLPDFIAHSAHDFITLRNATQSPLLRLPAEIRHRIWSYILQRPGYTHLGNDQNWELKVKSRKVKNIMRMGTTCRLMRVELNLEFLGQQTIEFSRRFFRKWMAVFTAEQHQAIRKVRVYASDAREDMDGFWDEAAKLGALEKFVLIVDAHERMQAKARDRVMGFFSGMLNSVIGHKVEFEVLERDRHNKTVSRQTILVI